MSGPTGPGMAYVDVATQTSPFTLPPSISPACPANPITSFLTATSLNAPGHLRPVGSSPDRGLLDASSVDCMPAAESCSTRSDLVSPRLPLPPPSSLRPQRLMGMGMGKATTRAVSLPETLHDDDLRHMLSQLADSTMPDSAQQSRVVSMPASLPTSETRASPEGPEKGASEEISIGELDNERSGSSVSSAPSTPRTIVVHSLNSDLLDTPSPPPSSCDSVEFTLEDPVLLPDSFLQSSVSPPIFMPEKSNKSVTVLEDDGKCLDNTRRA